MKILMVGVDKSSVGGILTVVKNYMSDKDFCNKTNLMYIPTAVNASYTKKILFFAKALVQIIRTIYFQKINIVHIHMAERGSVYREGIVLLVSKLMRCKTIIHMHGATIEDWYNDQPNILKKIICFILGRADKILVLGYVWEKFMKKLIKNKSKIEVVYNAVYVPNVNNYNTYAEEIMFLGVLIERKGIDDLLQALLNIKDKLPFKIKVKLYGADKNGNIKKKISLYGLESFVEYYGWLTEKNRSQCFSKAMLNILPSYNEGLPMTILETMSYGIPNIATNIAAIPEAIRNGEDGILVEPGDVDALGEAILSLVNDKEARNKFSQNSYYRVKSEFDIKLHLNKLYKLYEALL